ncbi:MAG: EF-hand domain-containing protein [Luteimonas sp.]
MQNNTRYLMIFALAALAASGQVLAQSTQAEVKAATETAQQSETTTDDAQTPPPAQDIPQDAAPPASPMPAEAMPADPMPANPAMPMPPATPAPQVTSSPADSVVGEYKIDFAALDANKNGSLSRSEVKTNATLTSEFRAVDSNRNGSLSQDELKGWMD